jgi:hypothetical protein
MARFTDSDQAQKARLATVTSQAGIWCSVMASQPVGSAAGVQAWKSHGEPM